jgi:hypothetical protein
MSLLQVLVLLPAALGATEDYFAIEGAFGYISQMPDTSVEKQPGPLVDHLAYWSIPGAKLPADLLLEMADLNAADFIGQYLPNELEWFPRTNSSVSIQTTYLHTTRCAEGVTGTHVQSQRSVYKKCTGINNIFFLTKTFQLPPPLCLQTCDSDATCVGYTTDAKGEGCWVLGSQSAAVGPTYWKVGTKNAAVTN